MNRKPGDWNCKSCQHLNFSRRESCQRCGDLRSGDFLGFGGRGSSSFGFTGSDVRPGDWYCSVGKCGTHNFASRSCCFKCGAFKEDSSIGFDGDIPRSRAGFGFGFGGSGGGGRSGWKSGDWICSRHLTGNTGNNSNLLSKLGCNEHNFASRTECFRCSAPKENGSRPPY